MVYDFLKGHKLLLASQSPRRQHLLKEAGFDFDVVDGIEVEEVFPDDLRKHEIPISLCKLKANAYKHYVVEKNILITADTIVWRKGRVIQKPTDFNDAVSILKSLSGKKHVVYTGVCLKSVKKEQTFFAKSDVYFDKLTNEEISFYVNNYKPFDKAGAYGIQEWIGYIGVKKIKGSFFNVMGLPVHQLYQELKVFVSK